MNINSAKEGLLAPFIKQLIREIGKNKEYYRGTSLTAALYSSVMLFLIQVLEDNSEDGIKKAAEKFHLTWFEQIARLKDLKDASAQDLVSMRLQLQNTGSEIKELESRAFGAETSLEQREREIATLKDAVSRLKTERANKTEGIQTAISPVIQMAEKEIEYLQRLTSTVGGMQSSVSAALAQLKKSIETQGPSHTPSMEALDVTVEISRRATWLLDIDDHLQKMGEDKQGLEDKLQEHQQLVKYADADEKDTGKLSKQLQTLHGEIQKLLLQKEEVNRQMKRFQTYQKSVEAVRTGLPAELIGQQLPLLPEFTEVEEVATTVASKAINPGTPSERRRQLDEIAAIAEVTPNAVLIISLYDCLEPGVRRSMGGLLSAAEEIGIISRFGFSSPKELWQNWRKEGSSIDSEYLKYGGTIGGSHAVIYRRTSESLPWSVQQLLTTEEIEQFKNSMSRNSQKK